MEPRVINIYKRWIYEDFFYSNKNTFANIILMVTYKDQFFFVMHLCRRTAVFNIRMHELVNLFEILLYYYCIEITFFSIMNDYFIVVVKINLRLTPYCHIWRVLKCCFINEYLLGARCSVQSERRCESSQHYIRFVHDAARLNNVYSLLAYMICNFYTSYDM